MKTLQDLTPEIRSKIKEYKYRAVNDLYNGNEYANWKRKNTVDYIRYIYALCKKSAPVVIVADTPLQYKYFYNMLFNDKMNKKTKVLVNFIFNKTNNLRSELDSELDSELRSELHSELHIELHSELYRELRSELHIELHSELDRELHSELRSELSSELDSELSSELESELYSELESELYRELLSELDIELRSELDSELDSELRSELHIELRSELHIELSRELYSELDSVKQHYLFLTNEYARVYLMWYKFIKDEFNLKTKKSNELDWLYDHVNNANIAKVFLCKKVCLVLRMPCKILRNAIGFHCTTNDGAIQYPGFKMHYINGRKISNWIFDKYFSKSLTFDDFIKVDNEDEKAGIITLIKENDGNEGLLNFLSAILVDERQIVHENGYIETIKLFKTKERYSFLQDRHGNTNVPYAWTQMQCPSTGQIYLIDTCSSFDSALDSIKYHRPSAVPESVEYVWQSAN